MLADVCCRLRGTSKHFSDRHRRSDYVFTNSRPVLLGTVFFRQQANPAISAPSVVLQRISLEYLEVTVFADPTGAMFYQMDPSSASNLIDTASKEEKQPTRCFGSPC
jgi:hypothetical protein